MRVFISWSGQQSKQVALILKEWLPTVIQLLDTWVSESDIEKGESWFSSLQSSLTEAQGVGVFCLTSENLTAPWMAFEAGALAVHDRGRVATFLHGIKPEELKYPLALFQATLGSSRDDVYRLVESLNKKTASPLTDARLRKAFDSNFDDLVVELGKIKAPAPPKHAASTGNEEQLDLLRSILASVRRIEKDYSLQAGGIGLGQSGGQQTGSGLLGIQLASGAGKSNRLVDILNLEADPRALDAKTWFVSHHTAGAPVLGVTAPIPPGLLGNPPPTTPPPPPPPPPSPTASPTPISRSKPRGPR